MQHFKEPFKAAEIDHKDEGFGYFISLENGDNKIIFKSNVEGDISVFKKEKL